MRILLPKASKGLKFDLIFTIDMNDFDVEMLLPGLFHLVRTKGRSVGKAADPALYDEYLNRLATSDGIQGFGQLDDRALLNRWVRTSVVKMGKKGRAHSGEQMLYLYPNTMLTYKAGLPKDITRLRGVHNFVYAVLLRHHKDRGDLDRVFRAALGTGLYLQDSEPFNGRYDGQSDIDIEAMLSIRLLDQLQPAGVGPASKDVSESLGAPKLQQQSGYFAGDILKMLKAYKQELPAAVLTRFLLAIINCHLLAYSVRLMQWVCSIGNGKGKSLPIYVDCTGQPGSYSDDLARTCFARDLEMLERYSRATLRLRTLDRFVALMPQLRAGLSDRDKETGKYLADLFSLANHPKVDAKADQEFEQICAENGLNPSEGQEGDETTEATGYLRQLRDDLDLNSLDRLVLVLFEAQRKSSLKNLTAWFNSVVGLNRAYGLASGNVKGRWRVFRYSLSNELLNTWVHAALADAGKDVAGELVAAARMPLRTFLEWLEKHFGVLINRPPEFNTSAEAVAAARQNLEAFKVRLRQIGVFQNLSDDFDAQYIERPVSQVAEALSTNA